MLRELAIVALNTGERRSEYRFVYFVYSVTA
jgi:hypothetical protein